MYNLANHCHCFTTDPPFKESSDHGIRTKKLWTGAGMYLLCVYVHIHYLEITILVTLKRFRGLQTQELGSIRQSWE